MKTPLDIIQGRIIKIDERAGKLLIEAPFDDWHSMIKRGYTKCNIQLIDSRPLSDKQRKTCYKLIKTIAKDCGQPNDSVKEVMKMKFLEEDLEVGPEYHFSLSDAPMSLVCAFQRYLVRFILDFDIPCDFRLLDFVDDVSDFIYSCLVSKKCCICGRPSDLHHLDAVGAGRDREDIVHEGMEVLPLCREHHTEIHQIGIQTFMNKYHLVGGIILDETLCLIYGLKREEEEFYVEPSDFTGPTGC